MPGNHIQLRFVLLASNSIWDTEFMGMCFHITNKSNNDTTALLRHYASHAKILNISISCPPQSNSANPDFHPITRALSSFDITQKVRALRLTYPPDELIQLISSFPLLKSLAITRSTARLDLQLQSIQLTWVHLFCDAFKSITLPSSIQVLHLCGMPPETIMSLLRQCPNLIRSANYLSGVMLRLNHFGKSFWPVYEVDGPWSTSSVQNTQPPVIDSLELIGLPHLRPSTRPPVDVITFCHQLSATLVSLTLERLEWSFADLHHLFDFSMPNLQILKLKHWTALFNAMTALTPNTDKHSDKINTPLHWADKSI